MKVVYSTWFTSAKGCIGVVVGEDSVTHERKAYIGSATGIGQKDDELAILEIGARLHKSQLLEILMTLDAKNGKDKEARLARKVSRDARLVNEGDDDRNNGYG